ncbi:MAG: hypothetical protein GX653_04750 [Clostridiales bacterium]|nr:hypothetical protein [Clostridiales bacterium]
MNDQRWKDAWQTGWGGAPEGFTRRMQAALHQAQRKTAPTRRLRPMLAVALSVLLVMGTALALEKLGVLDTLTHALRGGLRPEAKELVVSGIAQQAQQPALARFTVEEAVYDGRQVYLTLLAEPADAGKTLLMDREAEPSWAYDWTRTRDMYQGDSFADQAAAAGKMLAQADVGDAVVNGEAQDIRLHQINYRDGSILYTLGLPARGEQAQVQLNLMAYDVYQLMKPEDRGTLTFALNKSPAIRTLAADAPIALPEAGLVLTHCRVELTPIASYLTLRYALAEGAAPLQAVNFADGVWADWLDARGQPHLSGDSQNSLARLPDGSVELVQTFAALADTPQEITLAFYNGMTRQAFDRVTLQLTAQEVH